MIGLVSTFNVFCGIATYSEHLVEHFEKGSIQVFANDLKNLSDTKSSDIHRVSRCWERTGDFKRLQQAILQSGVTGVHFQHEFGLFQNHEAFCELLKTLYNNRISIYITFHTVFANNIENNKIYDYAKYCTRIIVHSQAAKDQLNLNEKCVMIPHGSVKVDRVAKFVARKHLNIPRDSFLALTFGFITPNKGALDNINVVLNLKNDFPDLKLLIAGMPMVHGDNFDNLSYALSLFKYLRKRKGWDSVDIIMKYIPEWELDYYAGAADIAIENYYQTNYSTSGMSHLVMSYGLPSVSSRSNILTDLNEERSLKYDVNDIQGMEMNLLRLLRDKNLREQMSKNCLRYAEQTSWENIAQKHIGLYEGKTI